jgi:cytosine/adenosine deaminase-related metal-dependent hydrolase
MSSPLIEDGCVIVEGDRIVDVGPTSRLKPETIDEEVDGVLMPGLINAHTHLELTNVPRPEHPGTFQDWILTTMASMRREDLVDFAEDRTVGLQQGMAQCLKFGVTCVGDISQNVDVARSAHLAGFIREVSFGECLGLGERRGRFRSLLARALVGINDEWLRVGVSPHAPYTVDDAGYAKVASFKLPTTTHLAETPDEIDFIRSRSGAFRGLYDSLGFDPGEASPADAAARSPVEWLCRHDVDRWLLAHVNYCDDADIELLSMRNLSVVWCPRTHTYFGHPPHRWRDMVARGVTVCVGTDSCASSPDLNLVDDLRLVYAQTPDVSIDTIWSLATTSAAKALNVWGGMIVPGSLADLIEFPTTTADPLLEVLETPSMLPANVWVVGGRGFSGQGRG